MAKPITKRKSGRPKGSGSPEMRKQSVTVRLNRHTAIALEMMAERYGITKSELGRQILERALDREIVL